MRLTEYLNERKKVNELEISVACAAYARFSKEGRELIVSDNEKAIIQKRKFLGGVDDQSLKKSWFSST